MPPEARKGCDRMTGQAEVTYLWNSGFVVKIEDTALVFDYYLDPAKKLPAVLAACKRVYFFASHRHFDHFSSAIGDFADQVSRYFLSFDIRLLEEAKELPAENSLYLSAYDEYKDEEIRVTTFSSTDEGISFLVEIDGWRVFHAGDFNWWYWKGDTTENIALAKNGFMKQMKHMDGLTADITFFPVDKRLEEYAASGAKEFCRRTSPGYLITMHNTTGELWQLEGDFFSVGQEIPIWRPSVAGEVQIIKRQRSKR